MQLFIDPLLPYNLIDGSGFLLFREAADSLGIHAIDLLGLDAEDEIIVQLVPLIVPSEQPRDVGLQVAVNEDQSRLPEVETDCDASFVAKKVADSASSQLVFNLADVGNESLPH